MQDELIPGLFGYHALTVNDRDSPMRLLATSCATSSAVVTCCPETFLSQVATVNLEQEISF
ncbi:MAG: hypothetical protein PUP93_01395 [Rhizonema sp. NSF051]|nr:hypothetical protein [Rhizonema sp. NSF051]